MEEVKKDDIVESNETEIEQEPVETPEEKTTEEQEKAEDTDSDDVNEPEENIEEITRREIEEQLAGISLDEPEPDESKDKPSNAEEKKDEETKTTDPVDELIERTRSKMEKRIDKLTAQKGSLIDENESLKNEIKELRSRIDKFEASNPNKQEQTYTYEQLDKAYDKAYQDGDVELMKEIRRHERENIKRDLREEYINSVKNAPDPSGLTKDQIDEWKNVHRTYIVYSDPKEPEIYPGSHKELNILNPESKLFILAKNKYQTDPSYHVRNGMIRAVSDAFRDIIKIRGIQPASKNSVEEKLKEKVKKLNLRTSQGSGKNLSGTKRDIQRPKTSKEELDDYIKFRKSKNV